MAKRSGKWYRKNEEEVMKSLGLTPTKNSGSGWVEKEDGQSETVICQLKSTDAESIRIHQKDLHTLEYNATVCRKLPVFAVQFIGSNEVYLMIKPELLVDAAKFLQTGEYTQGAQLIGVDLSEHEDMTAIGGKVIKSSSSGRETYNRELEQKFRKEKRSAT